MSVFISYRHKDRETAVNIAREFDANDIKYYLDVTDDESKETEDITKVITQNMRKSTHLLAIISPNTVGSWWVPFEIGQATISNRRICSYAIRNDTFNFNLSGITFRSIAEFLPEYLHKWPILVSRPDLYKFIDQYKTDTTSFGIEGSRGGVFESLNRDGLTKEDADTFHRNLKHSL